MRILLAEDNQVNQMLVTAILARAGARADIAGNGLEALEAMRSRAYDVILMDMRMPDLDGLEATRRIRELGGTPAQVPIIALTANATQDDRRRCLEAGMNDFMAKPIDANDLIQKIALHAKVALIDGEAARLGSAASHEAAPAIAPLSMEQQGRWRASSPRWKSATANDPAPPPAQAAPVQAAPVHAAPGAERRSMGFRAKQARHACPDETCPAACRSDLCRPCATA